jgi:hypothetical protein
LTIWPSASAATKKASAADFAPNHPKKLPPKPVFRYNQIKKSTGTGNFKGRRPAFIFGIFIPARIKTISATVGTGFPSSSTEYVNYAAKRFFRFYLEIATLYAPQFSMEGLGLYE